MPVQSIEKVINLPLSSGALTCLAGREGAKDCSAHRVGGILFVLVVRFDLNGGSIGDLDRISPVQVVELVPKSSVGNSEISLWDDRLLLAGF